MSVGVRITSVLLVLVTALVQVSIVWRFDVGGAAPDLLILVVASIALLTGSVSGAAHGFLAGVALATFAALPLGSHALVGTLVGYTIGRVGEALVTDEHPVPPLVAGVFATFVMQMGRPLVEFLVNPALGRVGGVWSQAALVTLISSVLAVPTYVLVRRILVAANEFAPVVTRDGGEASA
ncbi:MAG: rod shape-determining protein MreD [Thermoleophilia bacterium]|nr:rod shape-determining protein MreD [Thermoleophilia bacterium]